MYPRLTKLSDLKGKPVTNPAYIVRYHCHVFGQIHRVSNDFRLHHGPTQPGTFADLYHDTDLPQTLANLLHDLVWCDQSTKPALMEYTCQWKLTWPCRCERQRLS